MNKRYIIGFIALLLPGVSYAGYEFLFDDNSSNSSISYDSIPITDTNDLSLSIPDNSDAISICTFNIQFPGHFKKKDNESLADLLKNIAGIKKLVATPYNGIYPYGEEYVSEEESNAFFEAMSDKGFQYILSEEDTGPIVKLLL